MESAKNASKELTQGALRGPLGAWLRSDDLIKSREKEGERESKGKEQREGCGIVLIAAIKKILSGAETKSRHRITCRPNEAWCG